MVKKNIKIIKNINNKELTLFVHKTNFGVFKNIKNLKRQPWCFRNNKRFTYLYAKKNDEIVSCLIFIRIKNISNHLFFFFTSPKKRRLKIGRELFLKFLQSKSKLKTIHVYKNLPKAVKFYKRYGFKIYNKNLHQNNSHLLKWIKRAKTFNENVFKKKYLMYK